MQFKLKKKKFTSSRLDSIKEELTLSVEDKYSEKSTKIKVFHESSNSLLVPFQYALEKFGKDNFNCKFQETPVQLKFEGQLRDCQTDIIEATKKELMLSQPSGCIIAAKTGIGKSVLGLYLISEFKQKTLILVHKKFLMDQWIDKIKTFLPTARIGTIQGPKIDIDDKDIVIGMIQSIVLKNYPKEIYDSFGMVIVDETHHLAAETFSRSFYNIGTKKYTIGLSATPYRKDGLTKVIEWHIGKILDINPDQQSVNDSCRVDFYNIKHDPEPEEKKNVINKINMPSMVTDLINCSRRNDLIINDTLTLIHQKSDTTPRKILILSDRIAHLKFLYSELNLRTSKTIGLYIGKMKRAELELSNTCDIILGSYNMCSEGYDCPDLNTLILATPKSDITQSIGRIFRKKHNIQPIIIDYCDTYSIFKTQGYKRKRLYRTILSNAIVTNKTILLDQKTDSHSDSDSDSDHLEFIDD
jgi:superfamily II DNA or RNA helicase